MIYENVKRLCTKHKTNIATVEKACGIANGTIGKWAGRCPAHRHCKSDCRLFWRIGRLAATEAEKTEGTLSLVKEAQTEKEE